MDLLMEIDAAKQELNLAETAYNQAENDFVYAAVYRKKAAEEQLGALMKQAKEDNVIPFPMVRCEPPDEMPERSWQEFLMEITGRAQTIAVIVLVIALIVAQVGILFGWWK